MIFFPEEIVFRDKRWGEEARTQITSSQANGLVKISDLITGDLIKRYGLYCDDKNVTSNPDRLEAECDRLAKRCTQILARHGLSDIWLLLTTTQEELCAISLFGPKMLTIVEKCLSHYGLSLRTQNS